MSRLTYKSAFAEAVQVTLPTPIPCPPNGWPIADKLKDYFDEYINFLHKEIKYPHSVRPSDRPLPLIPPHLIEAGHTYKSFDALLKAILAIYHEKGVLTENDLIQAGINHDWKVLKNAHPVWPVAEDLQDLVRTCVCNMLYEKYSVGLSRAFAYDLTPLRKAGMDEAALGTVIREIFRTANVPIVR